MKKIRKMYIDRMIKTWMREYFETDLNDEELEAAIKEGKEYALNGVDLEFLDMSDEKTLTPYQNNNQPTIELYEDEGGVLVWENTQNKKDLINIRPDVIQYIEDNKEGMAESHLIGWFESEYSGKSVEECKAHLENDHDDSLEIEELEEVFPDINQEELDYCIKEFKEAVLNSIGFGAAYFIDSLGEKNKGVK